MRQVIDEVEEELLGSLICPVKVLYRYHQRHTPAESGEQLPKGRKRILPPLLGA